MAKEFFVLRGGQVLYRPGHYDIDSARRTMLRDAEAHPRSSYTIVKIEETYDRLNWSRPVRQNPVT